MISEEALETRAKEVRMMVANEAAKGNLAIWTIYNSPDDYPDRIIARMHLLGKGASVATEHVLLEDFPSIRGILKLAGLSMMTRWPDDEPQIIETWL